jgi:hypothetical protein
MLESAVADENRTDNALEQTSGVSVRPNDRRSLMPSRRSRLVTFRVSSEEYEQLLTSCISVGARSMSDFARASVLQHLQTSRPSATLRGDLVTVSRKLEDLDLQITDVHKSIRKMLGPTQPKVKDF